VYLNEGIMGSPLLAFAGTLQQLLSSLQKPGADIEKIKKELDTRRKAFVEGENKKSDENILAAVLQMYYEDIDKTQQPTAFYKQLQQDYGMLDQTETYKKFAADVFKTTMIFDNEKWKTFISNPSAYAAKDDPAILTASAFINNYLSKYNSLNQKFVTANNEYGRLYLKGVLAMNPEKAKMMYPDATFTMRASYGQVKSYKPKDATFYDYVTTSKGILEKYIAGDYEFDLPANQIELLRKKDFGQYADPVRKDLVVNFITTNDITGGNSGSPVINGKGELIGLAFDGNYEALSHKLAFDKDLNRTINVDIRYVLWCIDKLGGATNIINELKLVK